MASIPIDVFAPPDMKESFVDRICAETNAIWRPAGITFTWHRVTSKDEVDTSRLNVTIEKRRLKAAEVHTALGWIMFTGNDPDPSIHLSIAGAEDLLHRTEDFHDTVTIRHEMLIERALGRALSHEIGHYLLGSKAHTERGLMRAVWPSQQIFAEGRRGFELTEEERSSAAQRLLSESCS